MATYLLLLSHKYCLCWKHTTRNRGWFRMDFHVPSLQSFFRGIMSEHMHNTAFNTIQWLDSAGKCVQKIHTENGRQKEVTYDTLHLFQVTIALLLLFVYGNTFSFSILHSKKLTK